MANNLLLDMLNLTIYDMLCFAQSVSRTYVEFVTFLMFYSIGDIGDSKRCGNGVNTFNISDTMTEF